MSDETNPDVEPEADDPVAAGDDPDAELDPDQESRGFAAAGDLPPDTGNADMDYPRDVERERRQAKRNG